VINALITFLITAFVLFLIVKAVNKLRNLHPQEEEEAAPEITAEDYLEEIRDLLKAQTTGSLPNEQLDQLFDTTTDK